MDALRIKREQKQEAAKLAHRKKIEDIGVAVRQEVKELEAVGEGGVRGRQCVISGS